MTLSLTILFFPPSNKQIILMIKRKNYDSRNSQTDCKGVVRDVHKPEIKLLSTIFVRPTKDGSYRLILNLRNLNDFLDNSRF